jgi:hypothetical protein
MTGLGPVGDRERAAGDGTLRAGVVTEPMNT